MIHFLSALVLFFLILLFSAFAVLNRDLVLVRFDIFSLEETGLSVMDGLLVFEAPLFLIVFAAMMLGMVIGMALPLARFLQSRPREKQNARKQNESETR